MEGSDVKMRKIILFAIISTMLLTACKTNEPTGNTVENSEYLSIPLSDVSDSMQKYTFNANGVEVVYFAVLGSDGEIRTAFDACDICGGYKGYRQQGEDVVCINCGRVFNIDDIGVKNSPGGCWPSKLDHKIEGDNILISTKELANGRHRFA